MKMKFLFTFFLASVISVGAFAQASKRTSAWNYMRNGEWEKARVAIDEAAQHEVTKQESKTWKYRAQIYEQFANPQNQQLAASQPNAIKEVYNSYLKASELDQPNKRKDEEIINGLKNTSLLLYNNAIVLYNEGKYNEALEYFNYYNSALNALGDGKKDVFKVLSDNKINPQTAFYYIGLINDSLGNADAAKTQYLSLIQNNYDEADPYVNLARIYRKEKDTAKAMAILEQGMQKLPADKKQTILIDQINSYLNAGNNQKVIELGQKAIEMDPKNYTIYLAMGGIYEKMNKPGEAEKMYNKAAEVEPENPDGYYSLGVLYFNQGADKYNESNETRDFKKADVMMEEAKALWKKSIPQLEKVHALTPDDKQVIELLAQVHAKLGEREKSEAYRAKLKK